MGMDMWARLVSRSFSVSALSKSKRTMEAHSASRCGQLLQFARLFKSINNGCFCCIGAVGSENSLIPNQKPSFANKLGENHPLFFLFE